MRSKYRRYQVTVASITLNQPNGSDQVGITADFEGGFVLAASFTYQLMLVLEEWATIHVKVDGIAQGAVQQLANMDRILQVPNSEIVRVPQGRHRISLVTVLAFHFLPEEANLR